MLNPNTSPQTSLSQNDKQKKQRIQFLIIVFLGLMLAFVGTGGLLFLDPMALYERDNCPYFAIIFFVMAIVAFFIRKLAGFLAGKAGNIVLISISFLFGCVAPLGLAFPAFVNAVVLVSAIGIACILFQWWSHLCSFEHRFLMTFTSVSLIAGAAVVFLLSIIGINSSVGVVIVSLCFFVSTLLLCFVKNDERDVLCTAMGSSGALSRLRSKSMHRLGEFNYFGVGFLTAIAVEFAVTQISFQGGSTETSPATLFSIAMVLACLICFLVHYRSNFDIEHFSKSYFAFTCIIGFLPIPGITGVYLDVAIVYLLVVHCLQVLLIVLAIIELARFEEISPFWYAGEGVFLFGGMAVGGLFVKVALAFFGMEEGVYLICALSIVFVSFAQVLFDRVAYPEIELFVSGEFPDLGPYSESKENEKKSEGNQQDTSSKDEGKKYVPRFKNRIRDIERAYGLSPRQCEVLELLAKGRDTGYIVQYFQISRSTAKTHIYNIYLKLDIHSRQDLFDMIEGTGPFAGIDVMKDEK